ncbi:MAG TPA: undecaprenyldiphospho-muramoylpentapeptide beta-N-acetylglucosaminyltransferase [Xanthobacteraceae bacterium]|jgi:UDP-N-acetylglucosamine--N-acetylmuramyl-(pentapeptide) pyrophosphoryl-undecaprenol N-acetylglucosamine transferase|nr:undecaprenyldiphospho-muramoylpentapeptide beta-N-acetylglucosaminyltransferase [Xanthobacteraceae bacterium]
MAPAHGASPQRAPSQRASPLVVVAAGGTGGHLFPAEALSIALARRGITVDLATDERATRYGGAFPARGTHIVPSDTFRGRNPLAVVRTTLVLGTGVLAGLGLLRDLRPAAVIGFGGYPAIPTVVAARLRRIPTLIHEQNAVLGRANRLLSARVRAIATSFPGLLDHDSRLAAKAVHTGNPIRPVVVEAAATPYPDPAAGFRLLAFGGSQGARIMADIVPVAMELLPMAVRARLHVTQQAREEDLVRVRGAYARLGVPADVEAFFADLPRRMAASHLVVSRSGASTVAELAAIGRPAILVPLPHALDQDQRANAEMLQKVRGAIMFDQSRFTPDRLAAEIARLAAEPEKLAAMAAAARGQGILDAADRLADLVVKVGGIASQTTENGVRMTDDGRRT